MFATPSKLLLIAVDAKDEPIWGASVAPHAISLDYETESIAATSSTSFTRLPVRTEINISGTLLDGPVSIEKILKDIDGFSA